MSPSVIGCTESPFSPQRTRRTTKVNALFFGVPSCPLWLMVLRSEVLHEMILNHVKQVRAGGGAGNPVGFAGIDHQVKLFAGIDQRLSHLHRVLEMHVVVTGAMHLQQLAMQVGGGVYRRTGAVVLGVVL